MTNEERQQRNRNALGMLKGLGLLVGAGFVGIVFIGIVTWNSPTPTPEAVPTPIAPNSAPSATEQVETTPDEIQKQNLAEFEKEMPGAVAPYVAFVEPWLERDTNAANVRLEKTWNTLSVKEQRGAMNILGNTWFEIVKRNPANEDKPTLWLHGPDNDLIESLTPLEEKQ